MEGAYKYMDPPDLSLCVSGVDVRPWRSDILGQDLTQESDNTGGGRQEKAWWSPGRGKGSMAR